MPLLCLMCLHCLLLLAHSKESIDNLCLSGVVFILKLGQLSIKSFTSRGAFSKGRCHLQILCSIDNIDVKNDKMVIGHTVFVPSKPNFKVTLASKQTTFSFTHPHVCTRLCEAARSVSFKLSSENKIHLI